MLDEDAHCVDVIRQTFAVERALKRFEADLLRRHLRGCLAARFKDGRGDEAVREIGELFALARK